MAESYSLEKLFRLILDARLPQFDPWLYRYCGRLLDPVSARTYVRHTMDLLAFGRVDPPGIRALDAGSGFGFTLLTLAALGASEVHGLEVHPPMVETVEAYLPLLPHEVASRVQVRQGSVSEMPYEDRSFDLVLSIEAISHYRDVEGFVRETARVLRPGGVMIISDGNNGLNPLTRRKTHQIWKAFEHGPAGSIHGHRVSQSYEDKRRRFVEEAFPEVPAAQMARETSGMTFAEIEEACGRYLTTSRFPGSIYTGKDVPVEPDGGTVMERLFNPYRLGRWLTEAGFTTRVKGYWGGASGRPVLRATNTLLSIASPLTIYSARGFLIAARKR